MLMRSDGSSEKSAALNCWFLQSESSRPVSVISLSLVGGDMLPGKGYHHGLVWNQILLSQPLTSLLYDRMWKLTWISAWGWCLPLSREYDVSLRTKTSLCSHCRPAHTHTHTHTHVKWLFSNLESRFLSRLEPHALFSALLFICQVTVLLSSLPCLFTRRRTSFTKYWLVKNSSMWDGREEKERKKEQESWSSFYNH